MNRRITIRDIAAATGFHYSTVSLALRDSPRIKGAVREKIHAEAERLGYRPDPVVKALAAYRNAVREVGDYGTLAWLSQGPSLRLGETYSHWRYAKGAIARAQQMGYRIEEFSLGENGITEQRMSHILYTRGIAGVLIAPKPHRRMLTRLHMDISKFSVVTFGYSLAWPQVHLVTSYHARGMKLAMRKLRSYGYRRIGMSMDSVIHGRSDWNWTGGYLAEIQKYDALAKLQPYLHTKWNDENFLKWYRKEKPEVIITHNVGEAHLIQKKLGVRVPEDLGLICLSLREPEKGFAGVDQNSHAIGTAAVDLLVSRMHANERGIPEIPMRVLIEGFWVDGPSIRRVNR